MARFKIAIKWLFCFLSSFFFNFYFIFKLYNIVLVLPNIKMNLPQVYPHSPSWTLLPPPSPTLPLGRPSAPAPSIQYRASNLDWQLISYMILYMFQWYSPLWYSNPTAGHTHWGNQKGKRHVYPNVHRSTVYNSQDMEAT